jgi:oxygen-dependent protoporphyrinogen oxidase
VHKKFPHRAPPDSALLRCFLGGSRDETILESADAEIQDLCLSELQAILGITRPPLLARVHRAKQAMAQYAPGHADRVLRIKQMTDDLRGLALAGNAYGGIGVPDCIRSGSEAAAKVVADLAL